MRISNAFEGLGHLGESSVGEQFGDEIETARVAQARIEEGQIVRLLRERVQRACRRSDRAHLAADLLEAK